MRKGKREGEEQAWADGDGTEGGGPQGPLPLAVQWLGFAERYHGRLFRGPAQGLGVAGGGWGCPFGGW